MKQLDGLFSFLYFFLVIFNPDKAQLLFIIFGVLYLFYLIIMFFLNQKLFEFNLMTLLGIIAQIALFWLFWFLFKFQMYFYLALFYTYMGVLKIIYGVIYEYL